MIKFELTEQQVMIIANSLSKEPYGTVAELINNLQGQINGQQAQPSTIQEPAQPASD